MRRPLTCLLLLATFSAVGQVSTGSLAWWADKAKARGEDHIEILKRIEQPLSDPSLKDVVKTRTVFSAVPISSSVVAGNSTITTWYRLRVVSVVSHPEAAIHCATPEPIPQSDPIRETEIAVAVEGGTSRIDGINVTVKTPAFPPLTLGSNYLFLADVCSNRLASLSLGSASIYSVSPTGTIKPIAPSDRPLPREIQNQRSLVALATHVKALPR